MHFRLYMSFFVYLVEIEDTGRKFPIIYTSHLSNRVRPLDNTNLNCIVSTSILKLKSKCWNASIIIQIQVMYGCYATQGVLFQIRIRCKQDPSVQFIALLKVYVISVFNGTVCSRIIITNQLLYFPLVSIWTQQN